MLDSVQEQAGVLDERLIQIVYGIVWFLISFFAVVKLQLYELPLERYKQIPQTSCAI